MTTNMPFSKLHVQAGAFTNPRQYSGLELEELRELALAIGRLGLLYPLLVTKDGLIIGGQRRFLAITLLRECLLLKTWKEELDLDEADWPLFATRAQDFWQVPVRIQEDESDLALEAAALADNLHRRDLATYEIAARVAFMHETRAATGAQIAMTIGKSPGYVSKMLKAWKNACPALHAAWRAGAVPYDTVKQLAELVQADQERALAPGAPKKARGASGRPGIDTVKDCLDGVARHYGARAAPQSYAQGAIDALRWVAGQQTSEQFVEFLEPVEVP